SSRTSPARARPKRNVVRPRHGFGLAGAKKSTCASSTDTVPVPLVITSIAAAPPQLPAASRPRTHSRRFPFTTLAVGSAAEAWTFVVPNVPDIGMPAPAAAGTGPTEYSAAETVPPPRSPSLNVANRVVGLPTRTGVGLQLTLPATATGPFVSPPGRASVNEPLITDSER